MTADAEPLRSIEVERKYDVDDSAVLPDWSALPGVAHVDEAEVRELDARYLDTADGALARARVAVRRRSGGPDAGWHVKVSAPDGRHEWQWPLDEETDDPVVPEAVAAAIAQWAQPPFTPLARVRNTRTAYALRDTAGALVAEFVDDRVRARDERSGRESAWREWEVELGPAAPADPDRQAAFFTAVDAAVAAVGARPAASGSKLARTLGR
ncbi:CYTH domain-containing protein [Microbacterium lushaniae]|uniref:CYTH domain-containing protein n=1 Tax=Microbacterium lushaniae TaxID=2614639 RepID=A0A5J6L398_9MICO|nr:CYTH domain-containing protein [Microbacterium lushaniae]QEW02806.1 CYTH domain-containing protein [Microbacterium lushaniae]